MPNYQDEVVLISNATQVCSGAEGSGIGTARQRVTNVAYITPYNFRTPLGWPWLSTSTGKKICWASSVGDPTALVRYIFLSSLRSTRLSSTLYPTRQYSLNWISDAHGNGSTPDPDELEAESRKAYTG